MNLHKPIHIIKWLLPISWMYGFIVYIRNKFFRWGILRTKCYDIPIICVGNISVGGTGKTPHTEYIVKLLKDKYKVAVLSRGYKRKSCGFILSTTESTSHDIGDEPYQIKQKYPEVLVAVDKKRSRGIERLLALDNPPEVIVLDDGFQHRYVEPSYTIILSDYNRPVYEDKLLPAGRLREPAHLLRFCNDIIITKCPDTLQPIEYRIIGHDMDCYPFQGLFYTNFTYKNIRPVFSNENVLALDSIKKKTILLVTGIASPKPLIKKLKKLCKHVETLNYNDHYNFSKRDVKNIMSCFDKLDTTDKLILVTEKDAGRLRSIKHFDDEIKSNFYYIPIEINFLEQKHQEEFDKRILEHVRDYKRN